MDYYLVINDDGRARSVWRRDPETTDEQWYDPGMKEWRDSGSTLARYLVDGRTDLVKATELGAQKAIAALVAAA
jgi:hypothetical protein